MWVQYIHADEKNEELRTIVIDLPQSGSFLFSPCFLVDSKRGKNQHVDRVRSGETDVLELDPQRSTEPTESSKQSHISHIHEGRVLCSLVSGDRLPGRSYWTFLPVHFDSSTHERSQDDKDSATLLRTCSLIFLTPSEQAPPWHYEMSSLSKPRSYHCVTSSMRRKIVLRKSLSSPSLLQSVFRLHLELQIFASGGWLRFG